MSSPLADVGIIVGAIVVGVIVLYIIGLTLARVFKRRRY